MPLCWLPWYDVSPSPALRDRNLDQLDGGEVDVFIIGGGINGAVSAAALADRGLSVAIADRGDFAGVTSQESSNLVWGGFKYLQNYELSLVFNLCRSRNKLMKAYPTVMSEIGFLATLDRTAPFPSWLAALGTVGYWGIGGFATDRPHFRRPSALNELEPILNTETADAGVEYADAYLKDNDARFVWGFVRSALDRGAIAANYLSVTNAERAGEQGWIVHLRDEIGDREFTCKAASIVNAAGPFVDGLNDNLSVTTEHEIVYSKGIHLVVPQLTSSERVLAFFDDSQRLFYVIPMAHRSVIGTTDTRTENPNDPVTAEDRRFLLSQINARLNLDQPLTEADIIAERNGVRPLVVPKGNDSHAEDDWTSLSRKHEVEVDSDAKVISILGGKLTDCLNVGDEIVEAIKELGIDVGQGSKTWYGEPPATEGAAFVTRAFSLGLDRPPEVERASSVAEVLWRRHGRAAHKVLDNIEADSAQGQPVLSESDVLRAELPLFAEREMIVTVDDFLRRRTKLALIHRVGELSADPGMIEVERVLGTVDNSGAARQTTAAGSDDA